MNQNPRKKSPRAPSLALDEAIDGAIKIYDKERRHAASADAVAQHLGYKNANNGAAVKAMASIRYYGLLERPQEGKLAISKELEAYHCAPSAELRSELLRRWLKTPPLFAELLEKFPNSLPSDATLRLELIQRGFFPDATESVLSAFRRSVEFARYYEKSPSQPHAPSLQAEAVDESDSANRIAVRAPAGNTGRVDRIPVRLSGGRRAWLEVPTPFYEADKLRLKSQIDLLLTEEEESGHAGMKPEPDSPKAR